jgi:3-oxoacyl-[acyl-carrier protein] reductase
MMAYELLKGKTVVVTGASGGIGRETAKLLDELDANLVLGSRNEASLSALARQLKREALIYPLNVTNEESVLQFSEAAIGKFGKIDALINLAGTGHFASVLDLPLKEFESMVQVNLTGTFLCCKYFGRHMVQQVEGKILNVISIAGVTALPGCGGYSASKFGALGLTRVLQSELRGKGVQVSAILPGAVDTPFWNGMENTPAADKMISAASLARHIVYILCQPKDAVIDEIAILPPLGIL